MNLKYNIIGILFLSLFITFGVSAQDTDIRKNIDIDIVLGFNIGATAPLPLPAEVRKIETYNPKFNPQIGINIAYKLNDKWALGSGISLDWKGMRVRDEVKYMYADVTVTDGGGRLQGYFVGKNMTNIDMTYFTIPIYARYTINERWRVRLGGYTSRVIKGKFDGDVTDGYIRIDTPTGQKQDITEATFDFSDDMRDYDLGVLAGGDFKITNRIGAYANFTWGFTPLFYSNSNPIRFTMRNIYGTLGLSYKL